MQICAVNLLKTVFWYMHVNNISPNRIRHVRVSVLLSSAVDRRSVSRSGQTKYYKNPIEKS